jgi:pentatricopeptide repeat protein
MVAQGLNPCPHGSHQNLPKATNSLSFYISVLQGSKSPREAMLIHGSFVQRGFCAGIVSLWTTLLDVYAKFGLLHDARSVFDHMSHRNVVSWTAMIAGYARCRGTGDADADADDGFLVREAMVLFQRMLSDRLVVPNEFTLVSMVNACANLEDAEIGRAMHAHMVIEAGIDAFAGNALVNMYAKCGRLEDAVRMFETVKDWDVVTWTALISGYANNGRVDEALQAFRQLQCEGLEPNQITLGTIFGSLKLPRDLGFGTSIHCCWMHRVADHAPDPTLQNTLIDMYCKCGSTGDGRRVFDDMRDSRNVVSWNAMLAGYARDGDVHEAVKLHAGMACRLANHVTYVSMIDLFADIEDLECGRAAHNEVIEHSVNTDGSSLANALIHLYVSCRRLEDARWVFGKMPRKDKVSWSTLMAGFCSEERVSEAVSLLYAMGRAGVKLDQSLCSIVVVACASIGLLEQGMQIHGKAVESGIIGSGSDALLLNNALIDMYAKCGDLSAARLVFENLPCKDAVSWNSVVCGFAQHGCGREGLSLLERMKRENVEASSITFLCVLSACDHSGLADEACAVFELVMVPTVEHFACMVDLFARAGRFGTAKELIARMPLDTTAIIWRTLLTGCRLHFDGDLSASIVSSMMEFQRFDASS